MVSPSSDFTFPQPIQPGDCVAVVAPGGPVNRDTFDPGLKWLGGRYNVQVLPSIYDVRGYLAGDDARRRDEFAGAMLDRKCKAIFAARGGYGSTRILDDLPWRTFRKRPKWLIGFSDITAFHVN
jgi:muramoyltetrapeptide carboxypeptidase